MPRLTTPKELDHLVRSLPPPRTALASALTDFCRRKATACNAAPCSADWFHWLLKDAFKRWGGACGALHLRSKTHQY